MRRELVAHRVAIPRDRGRRLPSRPSRVVVVVVVLVISARRVVAEEARKRHANLLVVLAVVGLVEHHVAHPLLLLDVRHHPGPGRAVGAGHPDARPDRRRRGGGRGGGRGGSGGRRRAAQGSRVPTTIRRGRVPRHVPPSLRRREGVGGQGGREHRARLDVLRGRRGVVAGPEPGGAPRARVRGERAGSRVGILVGDLRGGSIDARAEGGGVQAVVLAAVLPHHAHAATLAALHRFRVQRRRSFRVAHHRLPSVVAVGRGRPSEPGPVRALAGRRDWVPAGGHGLRRGLHRTDPLADDGQPRRRHPQPRRTHTTTTENMGGGGFSTRT
mmetsp:Transcript_4517/g.20269  ORF Transcript_4517/g.20269 Transcript_4517/m.20269 type:complete len:328 (-) Transcript_4517:10-993(-)